MPAHKVAKAVKEVALLKQQVKDDTVLGSAVGIIDAVMAGDGDAAAGLIAQQMKAFQIKHDSEVIAGAKAGEKLGKGLLRHVGN